MQAQMDLAVGAHRENSCPFDMWTAASLGNVLWFQRTLTSEFKLHIDDKNKNGWTPLMYASYYGHAPVVEFLLQNGASVTSLSKSQKSPLMMSAMGGSDACTTMLLQHGANVNSQDSAGWTALLHAANYGYVGVVQILIAHGAHVNQQCSPENITALMVASESGHLDVVRILLEAGADTQMLSTSKQSAYSLACDSGHKNVAAVLDSDSHSSSRIYCGPKKVQELISSTSQKVGDVSSPSKVAVTPDLGTMLGSLGLDEYLQIFTQKNVDIDQFLKLTSDDLKALGVVKIGPRSKMANYINSQQGAKPKTFAPARGNLQDKQIPQIVGTLHPNTATITRELPQNLVNDFSSLQQKMKRLIHCTGSINEWCSHHERLLHAELVSMTNETDDLANDIYREFKNILDNVQNPSFKKK